MLKVFLFERPASPNCTGKRLCRLGCAARKAKIVSGLRSSGATPPFSCELPVSQQEDDPKINE